MKTDTSDVRSWGGESRPRALGAAMSVAQARNPIVKEGRMPAVHEFNRYGEILERTLILRTSPIAVKMLEKESDVPEDAFRPFRDGRYHIAQCQAFALSRREGKTVAMLREDHWCPTALMAYGMVSKPADIDRWSHPYDTFAVGTYAGIVSAPLKKAAFVPDVVIVYSNTAQLRSLLLTMRIEDVPQVHGNFFPPSCGHSVVDPVKSGKYRVVIPDPGEYQRALTMEDEMIFAIPGKKMQDMISGIEKGGMFSYRDHHMSMMPDFERPDFYKELFRGWGLE
jgi:uncharacterized protein (DUF169 family)